MKNINDMIKENFVKRNFRAEYNKLDKQLDEAIKQAGALLAQMASNDTLYIARTDGLVAEKSVKADTVAVSKKYVVGSESGASSDMLFVNDLLKPFLCGGGFSINTWVCK